VLASQREHIERNEKWITIAEASRIGSSGSIPILLSFEIRNIAGIFALRERSYLGIKF